MRNTKWIYAVALLAAATLWAGSAAALQVPLGVASGGVAVYYNDNGIGEEGFGAPVPNVAYLKAQFDMTNTNGAPFQFDPTGLPVVSFNDIFSGQPVGSSQFGIDLVLEMPTSDSSVATPLLTAYDNTDNSAVGRAPAGAVAWAINDYKDSSPSGPGNAANVPINSLFRGGLATFALNSLAVSGSVFTAEIEGMLETDGLIHWYNPAFGSSTMASFGLYDTLLFRGTLSYDSANDPGDDLVDFYRGDISVFAQVIPEPGTALLLGTGLLGVAGVSRRRRTV